MIIEPNDALIALVDGSGVRAEVVAKLKSASILESDNPEAPVFDLWVPD